MEKQEELTFLEISDVVYKNAKGLGSVVGFTEPYLRKEGERLVYRVPLRVKTDNRTIDMVGIAETTLDAYSGEILKTYTEEEIKNLIKDLLSRKADG